VDALAAQPARCCDPPWSTFEDRSYTSWASGWALGGTPPPTKIRHQKCSTHPFVSRCAAICTVAFTVISIDVTNLPSWL